MFSSGKVACPPPLACVSISLVTLETELHDRRLRKADSSILSHWCGGQLLASPWQRRSVPCKSREYLGTEAVRLSTHWLLVGIRWIAVLLTVRHLDWFRAAEDPQTCLGALAVVSVSRTGLRDCRGSQHYTLGGESGALWSRSGSIGLCREAPG